MRDWNNWLEPLKQQFRQLADLDLDNNELERFFEIEACLRLHERLIPSESCSDAWALLTGYHFASLDQKPLARRMCQVARHRLRFLRTATAWQRWLEWYAARPEHLRLYAVDIAAGRSQRYPAPMVAPERVAAYDAALEQAAPHQRRRLVWAKSGEYTFNLAGDVYTVRIPPELADVPKPEMPAEVPTPQTRPPITISMADLRRVAVRLAGSDPSGDWVRRADDLELRLIGDEADTTFTIDGVFHLVGMVGSGKSTLIFLLIYHLTVERGLRLAVMLNTVAESVRMAADLCRLGIDAAPALGTERGLHRLKYGQAHADQLQPIDCFLPPAPEAATDQALQWLTAPCAMSGALTEGGPIPAGHEPCRSLQDGEGKFYYCPQYLTCPVHQARQDLANAQVWIVNPASFLYSQAPERLSRASMRILEAVYRICDLVIVDEADRTQTQWDRQYTPVDDLAGREDAVLDWLNITLSRQLAQQGRRQLRRRRNNDLRMLAGEADRHACLAMHLLLNDTDLVEWLGRRPLTNPVIYENVAEELSALAPQEGDDNELKQQLLEEFRRFYNHPTSLTEGGPLAVLINDVRHEEDGLSEKLAEWLLSLLPWIPQDSASFARVVRHLEFGVVLTALDSRVDDLLRNWLWAAPDFGERSMLDQSPPQEYVDLVPESPLGNLLGYQYSERANHGGLLRYIQCYGIGRWLLTQMPRLYADLDGLTGPHVLLTSATSWSPGSPQFHVGVPPHAVLTPPHQECQAIERSEFSFVALRDVSGRPIRVSGLWGSSRLDNLARLVHYLTEPGADGQTSPIDRELRLWQAEGTARKVLLVVGSYAEARHVASLITAVPGWRGRALPMLPDDDPSLSAAVIRRGEIETFAARNADVLIAPLLAIQRGFNILDDVGGALLGSAFFLVRPYPPPDDLGLYVLSVNRWATGLLSRHGQQLPLDLSGHPAEAIRALRGQAYAHWHHELRLATSGLDGLPDDVYRELLWDQFVTVWQTIGRLVRHGRRARVFFVDNAFHPQTGRSMLRGWKEILDQYLGPTASASPTDRYLADTLYGAAYRALTTLLDKQRRATL